MEGTSTEQYWSEQARLKEATAITARPRRNWWDHPLATRYYRDQYRNDPAPNFVRPAHLLLADRAGKRKNGISFACGSAFKEMALVKQGLVEKMTCVELAPALVDSARAAAAAAGLSDRMEFVCAPFEKYEPAGDIDLVIWDHGLHHMYETREAVRRSSEMLAQGGVLVIDDFVGPTYNQYSEEEYRSAEDIRGLLPAEWFEGEAPLVRRLGRISIDAYKRSDPSEAADSGSILPALRELGADILPLGGHAYALALREAYFKFDETDPVHRSLMRAIFEIDRLHRDRYCHFALAFWRKG